MARKYFTLLLKEDGPWQIAFGDFDKQTVEDERDDYRDRGHKAKDLRIINTDPRQRNIQAAVDRLNGL